MYLIKLIFDNIKKMEKHLSVKYSPLEKLSQVKLIYFFNIFLIHTEKFCFHFLLEYTTKLFSTVNSLKLNIDNKPISLTFVLLHK